MVKFIFDKIIAAINLEKEPVSAVKKIEETPAEATTVPAAADPWVDFEEKAKIIGERVDLPEWYFKDNFCGSDVKSMLHYKTGDGADIYLINYKGVNYACARVSLETGSESDYYVPFCVSDSTREICKNVRGYIIDRINDNWNIPCFLIRTKNKTIPSFRSPSEYKQNLIKNGLSYDQATDRVKEILNRRYEDYSLCPETDRNILFEFMVRENISGVHKLGTETEIEYANPDKIAKKYPNISRRTRKLREADSGYNKAISGFVSEMEKKYQIMRQTQREQDLEEAMYAAAPKPSAKKYSQPDYNSKPAPAEDPMAKAYHDNIQKAIDAEYKKSLDEADAKNWYRMTGSRATPSGYYNDTYYDGPSY